MAVCGGSTDRVFSHDITTAILVSENNETAAMLVSQTSPLRVELFSYASALFCYNKNAGHVSENTLYVCGRLRLNCVENAGGNSFLSLKCAYRCCVDVLLF